MSPRAIATLVIAVILGLATVLVFNFVLNNKAKVAQEAGPAAAPAGTPVVVAAQPIARGVTILPTVLKVVTYPTASVPQGAFATIEAVTGKPGDKDTQRVALRDLGADEPVLATRVSDPGAKLNLSDIISPGMQAVSLRTSDVQGVAGFVLPGDHVDILLSRSTNVGAATTPDLVVQIVAQNMRVVAIDQANDPEATKPMVVRTVTLEATPAQAQTLTLAQSMGTLSFTLRHVLDTAPQPRKVTTTAILSIATRPKPRRPADILGEVRVTRDTETTVYQLSGR